MSIPTYNGKTIPVITLRPDWVNPVRWSQQYSTTISEALDTSEERQARFPRPLYRLNYTTLGLNAAQTAYLRTIIETVEDLPVACPLWPLGTQLTAAAGAGATTLAVTDTADRLFDVFYQYALIWEDFDQWEVVELDALSQSSCTLKSPLGQSYSTETILYPLAYGFVPRGPVTQLTDANGRWDCKFSETFHRLHDQSIPEAFPAAAPTVPLAPSSLTATVVSASQIDLSWVDESSDEIGFKIERKVAGGVYAEIASVGEGVTACSDTGLDAGTQYFYRVRAYNIAGDSAYSNEADATTTSFGPDRTGLAAWFKPDAGVAVDGSSLVTAWSDSAGNGHDLTPVATPPVDLLVNDHFGPGIAAVMSSGQQSDYMGMSAAAPWVPGTGDFTAIFLVDYVSGSILAGRGDLSSVQMSMYYTAGSGYRLFIYYGSGSGSIYSSYFSLSTPAMLVLRRTATTGSWRINKTAIGGNYSSASSLTINRLFGSTSGSPLKGYYGDILFYGRALSDAELDNLYDTYLKVKYPGLP